MERVNVLTDTVLRVYLGCVLSPCVSLSVQIAHSGVHNQAHHMCLVSENKDTTCRGLEGIHMVYIKVFDDVITLAGMKFLLAGKKP